MDDLARTASRLCQAGKGLAALDESTGTIGKRLEKAGLTNDEVRLCSPACLPSSALPCIGVKAVCRRPDEPTGSSL